MTRLLYQRTTRFGRFSCYRRTLSAAFSLTTFLSSPSLSLLSSSVSSSSSPPPFLAAAMSTSTSDQMSSPPFDKTVLLIGKALPEIQEQLMARFATVHVLPPSDDDANAENNAALAWLQEHGKTIDYIMTSNYFGVDAQYWQHFDKTQLQLVSSNGVGYDSIQVDLAKTTLDHPDLLVTHTPGVLDAETSTTAILLYLAVYRQLLSCEQYARDGATWQRHGPHPLSHTADGRVVGILGLGRIGLAIAKKLQAFDCHIKYHSRRKRTDVPTEFEYYDNLQTMAQDIDCLIVICPGGPATKHIVNADILKALGKDGVLINVARGSVVDETALIAALQDGTIAGAGLDVFENEPYIPPALQAMAATAQETNNKNKKNVVLLPHVGSATVETRRAMGQLTLDNLLQHAKDGTVLTPVPECQAYAKVAGTSGKG